MSTKRTFYIMIGVVTLLFCLVVASVVLGDLWMQKQSKKLLDVKLQNRLLEEQQISVAQAKKDVQKYADLEKAAKVIVPQDKDQARTVREIINIANANSIPITSIAFPTSTLGSATGGTSPSSSSGSSPSSSASTNTSSTGSASSTAKQQPSITQVSPVTGMKGVYQMQITIQTSNTNPIPYSSFINFLKGLENNRHTAQVSTMSITPFAKDPSKISFILGINVYIRP